VVTCGPKSDTVNWLCKCQTKWQSTGLCRWASLLSCLCSGHSMVKKVTVTDVHVSLVMLRLLVL
jgi:hypothetical protein